MENATILTGDLVASGRLDRDGLAIAFEALDRTAKRLAAFHDAPLRFTRHRGDGWQVVLPRPALALRSVLAFRAALRAKGDHLDSYMGLADGPLPPKIGPDLNAVNAPVFTASGAMLDALKDKGQSRARLGHAGGGPRAALLSLTDHISQGWTPVQATALLHMLLSRPTPTYTAAADHLDKSRQAVTKSLDAAGYDFLKDAMDQIEAEA